MQHYGLKPAEPSGITSQNGAQTSDGSDGMEVNIQTLQARVEALNDCLDKENCISAAAQGNIARFQADEHCLPMTFFADGLKIADHAFLNYGLKPAQDAIKDILDSSFPRAL